MIYFFDLLAYENVVVVATEEHISLYGGNFNKHIRI